MKERPMKRTTALSAAAALTLTVAGGVSALALTVQRDAGPPPEPTVIVEYVDQFGQPVAAPTAPIPVAIQAAPTPPSVKAATPTTAPSLTPAPSPDPEPDDHAAGDDEEEEDDD